MRQSEHFASVYKIVVLGDQGVGKTHIIHRYTKQGILRNVFPTIGVEFATKVVDLGEGGKIKAHIWDTAGQEKYKAITNAHFRRAVGAILVYDVTKYQSFENVKKWHSELLNNTDEGIVCAVIGNKIDLLLKQPTNRQVYRNEGAQFAAQHDMLFEEISAFTGEKVNETFDTLLNRIYQQKNQQGATYLMNATDNYNSNGIYITKDHSSHSSKQCC